jgi:aspartyl protease family protein
MDSVTTDDLIRASILALMALGLLLSMGSRNLNRSLKQAAVWGLIFVSILAGAHIVNDVHSEPFLSKQASFSENGRIEVPRSYDGHYHLTLKVNDVDVSFVVDTGASEIVLTKEDAERIGLNLSDLRYIGRAQTANGQVRIARAILDEVSVGGAQDRNVPATVNEGDLFQSLLGLRYLDKWDRLEISNGRLILERD